MTLDRFGEISPSKAIGIGAVVTSAIAVVGPLWDVVSATSNLWFPSLAVFSGTIAPELAIIPDGFATNLLLVGAAVYVGVLLAKMEDKIRRTLE